MSGLKRLESILYTLLFVQFGPVRSGRSTSRFVPMADPSETAQSAAVILLLCSTANTNE